MTRLAAHSIDVELPNGWDGSIYSRNSDPSTVAMPIMHLATFPLPVQRGDFGGGAVELMGSDDVFVSLFEYGPESVSQPLFRGLGMNLPLSPRQFNPSGLQRVIRGQAGYQRFFQEAGRAFCLYVVIGSVFNATRLARQATNALSSVRIGVPA